MTRLWREVVAYLRQEATEFIDGGFAAWLSGNAMSDEAWRRRTRVEGVLGVAAVAAVWGAFFLWLGVRA